MQPGLEILKLIYCRICVFIDLTEQSFYDQQQQLLKFFFFIQFFKNRHDSKFETTETKI